MFGPGFVWLVMTNQMQEITGSRRTRKFHILRTYGSGTPLSGAHWKRPDFGQGRLNREDRLFSKNPVMDVTPLLGVSVWQHSYLTDFGVAGKEAYLEAWWNRINWKEVDQKAETSEIEDRVRRIEVHTREEQLPLPTSF